MLNSFWRGTEYKEAILEKLPKGEELLDFTDFITHELKTKSDRDGNTWQTLGDWGIGFLALTKSNVYWGDWKVISKIDEVEQQYYNDDPGFNAVKRFFSLIDTPKFFLLPKINAFASYAIEDITTVSISTGSIGSYWQAPIWDLYDTIECEFKKDFFRQQIKKPVESRVTADHSVWREIRRPIRKELEKAWADYYMLKSQGHDAVKPSFLPETEEIPVFLRRWSFLCEDLDGRLLNHGEPVPSLTVILENGLRLEGDSVFFGFEDFVEKLQNLVAAREGSKQDIEPPAVETKAEVSIADELKKFAELRDSGVLTEEEFEKQKAKLLESE